MSILEIFLLTLIFTSVFVYRVWVLAIKIENFSIIDGAWSLGFFLQTLLFFSFTDGHQSRKIIFLLMVGAWSLRLSYFLISRIRRHHPVEDTRYAQLRQQYGAGYQRRFLIFFMYQAVSISILTFPFIFVFRNTEALTNFEIAGLVAFIISLLGESLADYQLKRFKALPKNKGLVCDVGLWKYSRHPNYFFESCIWFSFFIFMLGSGLVWAIYAPLLILFLLLKVTGVPPSEAQSLKTRGDLYRDYQGRTSTFFPLPRRK